MKKDFFGATSKKRWCEVEFEMMIHINDSVERFCAVIESCGWTVEEAVQQLEKQRRERNKVKR